jgi:hypothetical protein
MTLPAPELGCRQLFDELVEAHLDTIEVLLGGPEEAAWRPHVQYLQALVRQARRMTAAGDARTAHDGLDRA